MNTQEIKTNILNTIQTNTSGNITGNILQQVLLNMVNASDITFGSPDNIQYLKLENIENSQIKKLTIGAPATDIDIIYDGNVNFYTMNILVMNVAEDIISLYNNLESKDIYVDGNITLVHNKVINDAINQSTNYIKFTGVAANPVCEIKTNILDIISNTINMADISVVYNTSTYETTIGKQGLNIVFDSSSQDVELELQSDYDIKLNAGHDVELNSTNKITLTANDVVSIDTTNHNFNVNTGAGNINILGTDILIQANVGTKISFDEAANTINVLSEVFGLTGEDIVSIRRPDTEGIDKYLALLISEDGIGLFRGSSGEHISIYDDSGYPAVGIKAVETINLTVGSTTLHLDETKLTALIALLS